MEITWLGRSCFRIRAKEATVVTDPYDNKTTGYTLGRPNADIVTVSHSDPAHANVDGVGGNPRVIEGPGEFEISGASITGVATYRGKEKTPESGRNVAYIIELEDMRIAHLGGIGHVPTSDQIESMSGVDILMVPVGGGESLDAPPAMETVSLIEPKLVIPMNYKTDVDKAKLDLLDRFLKEMGAKSPEVHQKVTVTRSSLPDETQLVVIDYKK
jgi:L-ascorbate metabolism protein UlaG (beta-lactamase superfamily)